MRALAVLFLLAGVSAAAQAPVQVVDPAKGLTLSNDYARFEFAPKTMGLTAMLSQASGANHLSPAAAGDAAPPVLWELSLGRGTLAKPLDSAYRPCDYARIEPTPTGGRRAVMEWNDMRWWLEDRAVTVRVTVELPPDSGIAQWRIFVENRSDYWGLRTVAFPIVKGFPASGAYDIARPVFGAGGNLLKKWTETVRGRHPSGSWPMQFISFEGAPGAVYAGTRDSDGRAKDFVIEPGKQLSIVHHPENSSEAGSGWPDFYPVEFGVFKGSWIEAARHYRDWALKQKWAAAGKLSQRRIPALIANAAFWVCESWLWKDPPRAAAPSSNMAEWVQKKQGAGDDGAPTDPHELNQPLLAAAEQMGVPTALHWYNWHQMTFDNNYPHFFPERKGLSERVKELVSRGILVMPYINGSSADMNIADWDKFAPAAIVDEAGGFRHHLYSQTAGRLLTMCPTQSLWQTAIAGLVERLVGEIGVNGVYVDQVSAMEHELCYNRAHGHPLGGGRYWTDGNRDLMRKVRNVAERSGRDVTITSEGADEVFLDLVDANLTWSQATDWEIPLMQVVYSGYTLWFGSPVDYTQSDDLFRFAQGQALIDGRQNGWMNLRLFDPSKYESKTTFLKECVKTRAAFGRYLTYGQLVEPVAPLDPLPTFTSDVFGWNKKHRGSAPVAEGRLWRAEDGARAVFFANYTDARVEFRYRVGGVERKQALAGASVKVVELGKN
jgi:hypothetical protein